MNKLLVSLAAATMAAALFPAPASAVQSDGALPMYPGAKIDPKTGDMPASAIAQGVPLVLLTGDSLHAVDAWYGSNLPKSCARQAQSGGVGYKCPAGTVTIYVHGSTQIALIPAFGRL